MLLELEEAMRSISLGSRPENLEQIEDASRHHHALISQILEHVPAAVVQPVVECIVQLTDPRAGLPSPDCVALRETALRLGSDPRSYQEASDILEQLAEQVPEGSHLDQVLGSALTLLDQRGVLGRKRLFELARFLVGVERRPGTLTTDNQVLAVADEDLLLSDLKEYNDSLRQHSSLWGPQAAAMVLYPETQRFGALLEKVRPSMHRTLTVDRPSRALLPGRTLKQRWIRIDPVPPQLKRIDPIADIDPYVQFLPLERWRDPKMRDALDAAYAGVVIAMAIVQPLWLSKFKLQIYLVDEPGNKACFIPEKSQIYIWSGPLAVWSVVHEMAHVIDDMLYPGPGNASEQPGHPLNAFTALVRPYYRDVCEKRAESIWMGMIKNGISEPIRRRLRRGLTPLEDVLGGLGWLRDEERPAVRELLLNEVDIEPDQLDAALAPGHRLNGGELPLLLGLQDSIVELPDGELLVNIQHGWDLFRFTELNYLLSDREIFARFFDQYCRLYLNQLGAPYGIAVRPGDLPPTELAALVPTFHKAMMDAQLLDLGHVVRFHGRELESDTILSLGVAAGLLALGVEFIRPP